jgi:hypothetical protein
MVRASLLRRVHIDDVKRRSTVRSLARATSAAAAPSVTATNLM